MSDLKIVEKITAYKDVTGRLHEIKKNADEASYYYLTKSSSNDFDETVEDLLHTFNSKYTLSTINRGNLMKFMDVAKSALYEAMTKENREEQEILKDLGMPSDYGSY